jgi:hypothetical protein
LKPESEKQAGCGTLLATWAGATFLFNNFDLRFSFLSTPIP